MTQPLRVLSLYEGFFAGGARVLHSDVVAGLHAGGQQHSVLSIAANARREGTVQHMTADHRYQKLVASGVGVRTLGRTAGAQAPARSEYTAEQLELAAEALSDADVVLSLKEQPVALLLALQARGLMPDVPVAACLHRSDPGHSGDALLWLREAADRGIVTTTIACAQSTAEAYADAGVLPASRLVITNGVDIRRFRPGRAAERAAMRRQIGVPGDVPVVVFAARFDAMKDPELFLRAVARHSRRGRAHYLLCGAGMSADNPALMDLIARAGAAGANLHLLGIRNDMEVIYRIADIVALTSAFGEASPLCLLEGAASGAVPVTTDVGDAARETAGFGVVTPRDPDAIAAAWDDVLGSLRGLRGDAIAARGRLDRARMIAQYGQALSTLAPAAALAA
ncbi:MAG: glycosyltransferase [Microbacterium sp.]|uniref:glycosyltransferase n=1 Tax=Microbacterium sp. TaxID=51671 RepID=UPI00261F9A7C|nr:glycosyltransferase [Microbacterium sp.]MCX6502086.1 glycosyltransferase [Microbacterium sp.]